MRNIFFEPIHLSVADGVNAELSDLRFHGIRAVSRRMPRFSGSAAHPIQDVSLTDCRFDVVQTLQTDVRIPDAYWDEHSFDGLPCVRQVERLRMEQVEFQNHKNYEKEQQHG